jgi:hypothetical protein
MQVVHAVVVGRLIEGQLFSDLGRLFVRCNNFSVFAVTVSAMLESHCPFCGILCGRGSLSTANPV